MHQARRLVEDVLEEFESELFEDALGRAILRMVSGIDFGQPQLSPGVIERAECRFRSEAIAPAAFHDVKSQLEIRFFGRIDPAPQPATPDELSAAPAAQR